jgi:hypothetical protein
MVTTPKHIMLCPGIFDKKRPCHGMCIFLKTEGNELQKERRGDLIVYYYSSESWSSKIDNPTR